MLEPGVSSYSPIIKIQAPDEIQVLSRVQPQMIPGKEIRSAYIDGDAIAPDPAKPRVILVSADIALACSIFAAALLKTQPRYTITAFAQFDDAVPFKPVPSQILMPACPPDVIAAVPLLDAWSIPSRLVSAMEKSGFFHGDFSDFLELWWQRLSRRDEIQILGYGPRDFLKRLEEWCIPRRITLRTAEIPA